MEVNVIAIEPSGRHPAVVRMRAIVLEEVVTPKFHRRREALQGHCDLAHRRVGQVVHSDRVSLRDYEAMTAGLRVERDDCEEPRRFQDSGRADPSGDDAAENTGVARRGLPTGPGGRTSR